MQEEFQDKTDRHVNARYKGYIKSAAAGGVLIVPKRNSGSKIEVIPAENILRLREASHGSHCIIDLINPANEENSYGRSSHWCETTLSMDEMLPFYLAVRAGEIVDVREFVAEKERKQAMKHRGTGL